MQSKRYTIKAKDTKCCVCGYIEKNGNTLLDCGRHYMCDECLLSGEAIDHECQENNESNLKESTSELQ